jgi:hypothetical protein
MKQTAVQFLWIRLFEIKKTVPFDEQNEAIIKAYYEAKEMEKEQIINAIKLTIEKEYYEQTWAHCGSRNHMAERSEYCRWWGIVPPKFNL